MQSLERKRRKESFEWWLSFREEVSTAATWRRSVTSANCSLGDFFFRFLSFLFSVVSVVEKVVAQRVLELDKQV